MSVYRYSKCGGDEMDINVLLKENGMTRYRLSRLSGVPHATLSDLCSGKSHIEKCSGETLYKIAEVLQVPMESLLMDAVKYKNEKKTQK